MSSEQNLQQFLKNPREFLRSPLPRVPCKISVIGPPYSGKTLLSNLLAKKYNAKVKYFRLKIIKSNFSFMMISTSIKLE